MVRTARQIAADTRKRPNRSNSKAARARREARARRDHPADYYQQTVVVTGYDPDQRQR